MFLFLLSAILSSVYGVCFQDSTSSTPRIPIEVIPSSTLPECKLQCIIKAACESAMFNTADLTCILLGEEIQGQCITPYTRAVKTFANCQPTDLVSDYVRDPCFASAATTPPGLRVEIPTVCPNTPLDGEPSPRVYVVSVIYPDGSYGVYDNDESAKIIWNATIGSYAYYYMFNGVIRFNDPIYAATCVYYPAGVPNDCACTTLPQDPSASGRNGAITLSEATTNACDVGYSGSFIVAKHGIWRGCGPCTAFNIKCINKLWILSQPSEEVAGTLNSFALSHGTCYLS